MHTKKRERLQNIHPNCQRHPDTHLVQHRLNGAFTQQDDKHGEGFTTRTCFHNVLRGYFTIIFMSSQTVPFSVAHFDII